MKTNKVRQGQNPQREKPELTGFLTFKVSQLHAKLNAQAGYILRSHAGLSLVQWRIIALVNAIGPSVPSSSIISQVGMDKGLFSRNLKDLIASGYVEGESDPSDHRRILLSLTDKGQHLHDRVIKVMRARQKHLLEGISNSDQQILFDAFKKIERNAEARDFR